MMTPGTVFIVDDDASVRSGLSRLVRSAGFETEPFASAEEFLARRPFDGIGCVLLDLRMPKVTGAQLQERLAARGSTLPIIFLSGHGDVSASVRAMKQGAVDFLTKPVDDEVLVAALAEAMVRHRSVRATRDDLAAIAQRIATLTAREHEVMRCVIGGALNKQTAGHLGIAERTVKVHRAKVMEKMAAGSVADLVRSCDAAGLTPIACG